MDIEIAAKTRVELTTQSGNTFPAGTAVILLEMVGNEWFTEFVMEDPSKPDGKRWDYMMVHKNDLMIQ